MEQVTFARAISHIITWTFSGGYPKMSCLSQNTQRWEIHLQTVESSSFQNYTVMCCMIVIWGVWYFTIHRALTTFFYRLYGLQTPRCYYITCHSALACIDENADIQSYVCNKSVSSEGNPIVIPNAVTNAIYYKIEIFPNADAHKFKIIDKKPDLYNE